jgi:hypothetical protein
MLTALDAQADDYFGWAVAISGDGLFALVGAPYDDNVAGLSEDGSARLYSREGTTWTEVDTLAPPDTTVGANESGISVALDNGARAFVGSYAFDAPAGNAGSLEVFRFGAVDDGAGAFTGTVQGLGMTATSAFLFNDPSTFFTTSTYPFVILTDNPDACTLFASGTPPSSGHMLFVQFSQTQGAGTTATPGTYALTQATPPEGQRGMAQANFGTMLPNCGFNAVAATTASMDLDTVSFGASGRASGTFVGDYNGEVVSATFDAVYCADVNLNTLCN